MHFTSQHIFFQKKILLSKSETTTIIYLYNPYHHENDLNKLLFFL